MELLYLQSSQNVLNPCPHLDYSNNLRCHNAELALTGSFQTVANYTTTTIITTTKKSTNDYGNYLMKPSNDLRILNANKVHQIDGSMVLDGVISIECFFYNSYLDEAVHNRFHDVIPNHQFFNSVQNALFCCWVWHCPRSFWNVNHYIENLMSFELDSYHYGVVC